MGASVNQWFLCVLIRNIYRNINSDILSELFSKLTGTTDFFRFSVDAVRDKCLHEVLVDPELKVKNGTNNMSVYDIVVAEACLNDCSGKGTCTNGDCVCQANYGGSDCSVDLRAPPQLSETDIVVTCDMSRDTCDIVSVRCETFVEGVSTCLVEKMRVTDSGYESVVSAVHMATVISHAQYPIVTSDIPGSRDIDYVRAYRISIANIAGNYGDSVGLIVFNRTCIRTDGGREAKFNWTVKGPYCLDKGACVTHGDRQSGNDCVCDVSGDKRTWKTGSDSRCQSENRNILLISIAASVGGCLLLLIIVVVVVCACKRSEIAAKKYNVTKKAPT